MGEQGEVVMGYGKGKKKGKGGKAANEVLGKYCG